jgi:hypothetical protein
MGFNVCSVFATAFMIKDRELDCQAAIKFVKRKCGAKMNPGFVLQLEQYALVTNQQKLKKVKQHEMGESSTRLMTGQTLLGAVIPIKKDLTTGVLQKDKARRIPIKYNSDQDSEYNAPIQEKKQRPISALPPKPRRTHKFESSYPVIEE